MLCWGRPNDACVSFIIYGARVRDTHSNSWASRMGSMLKSVRIGADNDVAG